MVNLDHEIQIYDYLCIMVFIFEYWFHIKGGFIGMLLAIPAALVAGVIVIL